MNERFLRATEVAQRLGITRQSLWRWTRSGYFPPSRQIGPEGGRVGWFASEIEGWMRSREIAVGADDVDGAGK